MKGFYIENSMLRYISIGSGQKFIKTYFVFSVCYKEKNRKSKVRPKVLLGLGKSKKENKKIIFAQQCGFDVWQEWITLIKNKINLVQDRKQMIPKVRPIFFIKKKTIEIVLSRICHISVLLNTA